MSKTPWYDDTNPDRVARGLAGRTALWIALAVLFVAALSIGGWAFHVATSDAKGQGDAVRIKNDGRNRVNAQEEFEQRYQDVVASDRRLDTLAAAKKAHPEDRAAETNYAGAVTYCVSVVGDYNAAARKYSKADFRAVDLPAEIDNNDPATDCQETK